MEVAGRQPQRFVGKQTIVLVHSGLMEVPDRDPTAFFEAIAQMRAQGDIADQILRVVTLRATGPRRTVSPSD